MLQQTSQRLDTRLDSVNTKHTRLNNLQLHWWRRHKIIPWLSLAFLAILLNGIIFTPVFSFSNGKISLSNLMHDTVSASGLLQYTEYNLNFQVSGSVISEIDVTPGQSVIAGQVLARLNPTPFFDAVNVAQAYTNVAQVNLQSALANMHSTAASAKAIIAAAEAAVNVAHANRDVISEQSNANVSNSETSLTSDQNTLNQVIKSANAQTSQAAAQQKQSLQNCQDLLTPTPTSTANYSNPYETCVKLANAQYQQSVKAANVSVAASQAQVNQDKAALDLAHTEATVNNKAASGQVTTAHSQATSARHNPSTTSAQGQTAAAQGQLEVTSAQLLLAKHNLEGATLLAPHSGVITDINGTVGGYSGNPNNVAAGNGSAGSGPFIRLIDLSSAQQIQANVDESNIIKVQDGQSVQFNVKAYTSRQFKGTVSTISPEGIASSAGITYPIIITIDPKSVRGVRLLPNMTVNVTITVG